MTVFTPIGQADIPEPAPAQSSPFFFFSYARNNKDVYLSRFFQDLSTTIFNRAGLDSQEQAGFLDELGIETGTEWRKELGDALRSARTFVAVYSPHYFSRPWCGKEWQLFSSRIDATVKAAPLGTPRPPLIVPVLWIPQKPGARLPVVAADLQYSHQDFGALYAKEGLRFLMQLSRYEDEYQQFLIRFADTLINASRTPATELAQLPRLELLRNAFESDQPAPAPQSGPRNVQFFFIAGRPEEMPQAGRSRVECYGQSGGREWMPYRPPAPTPVGLLAQNAATSEGLQYDALPLDQNLLAHIEEAQKQSRLVVLIVDSWTLQLERYRQWMREFDQHNFWNTALVLPWNLEDKDTQEKLEALRTTVQGTFFFKGHTNDYFVDTVQSLPELEKSLSVTLTRLRSRAFEYAKAQSLPGSPAKPVLQGPVGGPS